jgi:hypothetical protein
MAEFLKQITPIELDDLTGDELHLLRFISDEKWKSGFFCRKCGHTNFCKGKTPYSRRCTRCKKEESATANTIFHGCHLPLVQAFRLAYEVCQDPAISTYELARQLETRQMTCWKLKKRMMECIQSRGRLELVVGS